MAKRLLRSALVVVAIVAMCLSATSCRKAQQPSPPPEGAGIKGGPLEIGVLWPEGSAEYQWWKGIGDSLEKDYPGTKVTYTLANTQQRPAIELRWKSGNPPDVDVVIFNGQVPETHDYVKNGMLLDLTDALRGKLPDGTVWEESILPSFKPFLQYEGRYYAVPMDAVVMLFHYNKDIFERYNLQEPRTWDDLLAVAQKLKDAGVTPFAVTGTFTPYMGLYWDHLLLRMVGPEAVKAVLFGGTSIKENPGFLKAAKMLRELVDRGYFLKGFEGVDFTTAQMEFFKGNAAMILMGTWLVGEMKDSIPPGFRLGLFPFPEVPGGQGDQAGLFGTTFTYSVAKASKVSDLAVEMLRRAATKEQQAKRVEALQTASPYKGVPAPKDLPGIDRILESAGQSPMHLYYSYGVIWDKERSDAWYNPVGKLFMKKLTPEQMLEEIDSNLQRIGPRK